CARGGDSQGYFDVW
nr:immunoglobulin heavy chain junction region [Mus musculus]